MLVPGTKSPESQTHRLTHTDAALYIRILVVHIFLENILKYFLQNFSIYFFQFFISAYFLPNIFYELDILETRYRKF